jgi:hypothetical protein
VAPGVAKVGPVFPRFRNSIRKAVDKRRMSAHLEDKVGKKNEHETVARARRQKKTKPGGIEATPDLCEVRSAGAASRLVDLVRPSCYSGLQLAVTKCIGTAARRKA